MQSLCQTFQIAAVEELSVNGGGHETVKDLAKLHRQPEQSASKPSGVLFAGQFLDSEERPQLGMMLGKNGRRQPRCPLAATKCPRKNTVAMDGSRSWLITKSQPLCRSAIGKFDVFPGCSREILAKSPDPFEFSACNRDIRCVEKIKGHMTRIFDQQITELGSPFVDVAEEWALDISWKRSVAKHSERPIAAEQSMFFQMIQQPIRLGVGIVAEKKYEFTMCCLDTEVPGPRRPSVGLVTHDQIRSIRMSLQPRPCSIIRAVIDDDNLELAPIRHRLCFERSHNTLQICEPVVGRYNDTCSHDFSYPGTNPEWRQKRRIPLTQTASSAPQPATQSRLEAAWQENANSRWRSRRE